MRNPESFRGLRPESDVCLRSLLAQIEDRTHDNPVPTNDRYLMEGLYSSVIEVDKAVGECILACPLSGCEVICGVAGQITDSEATIMVLNPAVLSACTYEG